MAEQAVFQSWGLKKKDELCEHAGSRFTISQSQQVSAHWEARVEWLSVNSFQKQMDFTH